MLTGQFSAAPGGGCLKGVGHRVPRTILPNLPLHAAPQSFGRSCHERDGSTVCRPWVPSNFLILSEAHALSPRHWPSSPQWHLRSLRWPTVALHSRALATRATTPRPLVWRLSRAGDRMACKGSHYCCNPVSAAAGDEGKRERDTVNVSGGAVFVIAATVLSFFLAATSSPPCLPSAALPMACAAPHFLRFALAQPICPGPAGPRTPI